MKTDRKLTYRKTQEGEWVRIEIKGPITEEAKSSLEKIVAEPGDRFILDMTDVGYVNSSGIRDWSYIVKILKEKKSIVFDHVPDDVVRTMNMIPGFRQGLPVRSVLRTYCCDDCNTEKIVKLTAGQDYQEEGSATPPAQQCDTCARDLEPIDADENFFLFLNSVA